MSKTFTILFLFVSLFLVRCGKSDSSGSSNPAPQPAVPAVPTVASIAPASASVGGMVVVTGTNLTGATAVSFGGTAASSFVVVNATTINAVVSSGTTGEVKVTTPGGSASVQGFTYIPDITPCKLANASSRPDVALGFPRISDRIKTTGTLKISVIFVDFSDAVATRTPQEIFGIISPASENFIKTVSQNQLTINFDTKLKWYRMSKPSSGYGWSSLTFAAQRSYIQEAVTLADPDVDFSQSDMVLVVSNPDAGSITNGPAFTGTTATGITADGKTFANGATSGRDLLGFKGLWFPHEFGHDMGLVDLYAFTGVLNRFAGDFSIMGKILGTAPEYSAWERWLLGWITDSQVRCISTAGTGNIDLVPIESNTAGLKLLTVQIDATTAVIVEYRRAIGYDATLTKEGAVVYVIDTKIATGAGVVKVLPLSDTDEQKLQAPLSVGQSVTYNNITIKCTAATSTNCTIAYEKK